MPTNTLAAMLGRHPTSVSNKAYSLGMKKSAAYLSSAAACRLQGGHGAGVATRFRKGQVPANKGLRRPGWAPGRMRESQFKPGTRKGRANHIYKPIGTERLSKDGILQRKVHDGLPMQSRWQSVHSIVWCEHQGPIPAGHVVVFRDGNRKHIAIENLECIPRQVLMSRNTVHNLPAPLPELIQLRGAIKAQITRKERKHENQDSRPA